MQITWLPSARIARKTAIEYIAQENMSAALTQLDEIDRQIDLLSTQPKMGRIGRVAKTRELVLTGTPFILIYRIKRNTIQILHFLHGAQQWPKIT